MTVAATAVWRVRPSGSNTNGGGYDTGISSAATGSNGSLSGVTFTDATAAAFTSGMVGASINIVGVGQYLIASRISASQITLGVGSGGALPQLSGNYAWTVGAGQDYSQQNAAQATGTHGHAVGTTTFTDLTALAFTAAMVGNAIYITGDSLTTGWYFVTGYTSSSVITLDRTPGTSGASAGTWSLGGGWADPITNTGFVNSIPVPGNYVYVLGSGTPNPASYTFDYTVANNVGTVQGNSTSGKIVFACDPMTPNYLPPPDTSGGMPCIGITSGQRLFLNGAYNLYSGLWMVMVGQAASVAIIVPTGGNLAIVGCVFDQAGYDGKAIDDEHGILFLGSEIFSSVGGSGSGVAVYTYGTSFYAFNNIHDVVANGIQEDGGRLQLSGNIIAKCGGYGFKSTYASTLNVVGNTIDGNAGNGVDIDQATLSQSTFCNNILSNHTTAGKYAFSVQAGTASVNDALALCFDFNTYYNNTTNLNVIGYGPHDTQLSTDPYVGQSTENYALA